MVYTDNYEKERQEAIDAGNRALYSLKEAKAELDSARGWGVFDIIGGGFITDIIKHSKMNNAQNYMETAKYDLQNFSRELQDVSHRINFDFNTSDFLSFADYIFDGFITDFLVQERINKAREQVDQAIRQVEQIVNELERQ